VTYKLQLKKGIKVEREHKNTYSKVKKGKIKTSKEFYSSIAKEHIKENPEYYNKLEKANL